MASPDSAGRSAIGLAVGATVPGTAYRLIERIATGRGPSADQVWIVRHAELAVDFVMKLLPLDRPTRESLIDRIQRVETRAQSGFAHRNLVRVFDVGVTTTGQPYFVLEKLVGATLRAEIEASGHVPLPRALELAAQILDGLDAAHGVGAIHKHLQSEKIFVTCDAVVKVLGFGRILDVGADGMIAPDIDASEVEPRTAAYAAPELATGAPVDQRADIFAAGVILYEMVTGQLPPPATSSSSAPAPPSVISPQPILPEVDRVVLRAMAPDREARFPSAASFAAELRRVSRRMADEGAAATDRPPPHPAPRKESSDEDDLRDAPRRIGGEKRRAPAAPPDDGTAAFPLGGPRFTGGENVYTIAPGTLLASKYRVVRVIGKGGMGIVVEAKHLQLDTRVAMKFLLPEFMSYSEASGRFLREARAASKIQSHHVARVLDVGTLDSGEPYMVMEFLAGEDLSYHTRASSLIPIGDAIEYITQACDAIAEAHVLGIVHRDLKPANLFLTRRHDGAPMVKVLDFGISKVVGDASGDVSLTQTTTILGSALYMSPEQMRSAKDVDQRTDIYALGVCLFELIGREQPYFAETFPELCAKVFSGPPKSLKSLRPEVPDGLVKVIERALTRDPEKRFQTIAEFVHALSPYARPVTRARIDELLGRYGPSLKMLPPAAMATSLAGPVSRRRAASSPDAGESPRRSRALPALVLGGIVVAGLITWQTFGPARPTLTAVTAEPAAVATGTAAPSPAPKPRTTATPEPMTSGSASAELLDAGADGAAPSNQVAADPASTIASASVKPAGPVKSDPRGADPRIPRGEGVTGHGPEGPALLPAGPKTPPPPVNTELVQETCTAVMPDGTKKVVPCQ